MIESAFGFDLSPLLARSDELAHLGQEVVAERAALRKAGENFYDLPTGRPEADHRSDHKEERADGDWHGLEAADTTLVSRIPRNPTAGSLREILRDMTLLKEAVLNQLEIHRRNANS